MVELSVFFYTLMDIELNVNYNFIAYYLLKGIF